ncbi:STAS domain-containing protein [Streptomyces sp. H27-D2]|uniref:STAS domain-containing protein n=1 Tax=Streptomyces sp. H27-D2 TaxID=3046304 RepID=UPI002DBFAAF0|nr:STAS domain-containing protein [Streptomyces sp. H27-D2]MEC4016427.1 STAS domain-containing protein [Streptomyces sp. H27-D2]
METFTCPATLSDGVLVLSPRGEIDIAALPALDAARTEIDARATAVCLDLSGVPFMDTAALHFLGPVQDHCASLGVPLRVSGLRSQHLRLFRLTGFRLLAACSTAESRRMGSISGRRAPASRKCGRSRAETGADQVRLGRLGCYGA